MKKLLLLLPGLALAAGAFVTASQTEAQGPPEPNVCTLLAEGVGGAFGGTVGPDGAFYVTTGGTGGDTEVEVDGATYYVGLTGEIVRIDPVTGAVTTFVGGMPSAAEEPGGAGSGIGADVVFIGNTAYFLTAIDPEPFGLPGMPVGIYRVNTDGTFTLIADLGAFAMANTGTAQDIPTGNPFSLEVRGDNFIVADANANRILSVTHAGAISIIASFENVVPTDIATMATGPIYVTWYSPFPHGTDASSLVSVNAATGAATTVDVGTELIGVDFSGTTLYVVNMGAEPSDPEGPPAEPFTGTLYRLVSGELRPIDTNFMLPVSLEIGDNRAFILTLTGEVWKCENLSALQEITPTPTPSATATPTATATATATATSTTAPSTATATATATTAAPAPPSTGSGSDSTGASAATWTLVALAGAAFALAGTSIAISSRRRA